MQVSVIIPVYNAASFVTEAVQSALEQPETGEVLLVEDGSTDQSPEICQKLAEDNRVRVVTHPGHVNKGVAASRNLGITETQMPYVAFLDADDVYVPGRFQQTQLVFETFPDADGVYETIGVTYPDDSIRDMHIQHGGKEKTGLRFTPQPEQLFRVLATGKYGHLSLDGIVLKRQALTPDLRLDIDFVLSEDSEFILRLAAQRKLYGGPVTNIVALRGVHGENTLFTNPHVLYYRRKYLQKCIDHHFYKSTDATAAAYIVSRRVGAAKWFQPFRVLGPAALPFKLAGIAGYCLAHPSVLLNLIRLA